ncbi:hypothetical protein IV203_033695 [Nitzschia inconspicua]|uniref:Uncharacterized protein n=1 Tax=Nitzschia inconspicua TaxID=303405 RepID=A0A9K3Q6Z2_9STRA|nr:hypothetical protein IV203_033695 [Nitzschia inconspicua]
MPTVDEHEEKDKLKKWINSIPMEVTTRYLVLDQLVLAMASDLVLQRAFGSTFQNLIVNWHKYRQENLKALGLIDLEIISLSSACWSGSVNSLTCRSRRSISCNKRSAAWSFEVVCFRLRCTLRICEMMNCKFKKSSCCSGCFISACFFKSASLEMEKFRRALFHGETKLWIRRGGVGPGVELRAPPNIHGSGTHCGIGGLPFFVFSTILLKSFLLLLCLRRVEDQNGKIQQGGSNQVVVETPGLSLPAVFRTGWANRGRDTLWEYISDSFVLSKQAGKTLSKWTRRIGDVIYGGQPPIFDDIGGYHSEPASDPYYEDEPWMNPRLT